MLRIFSVARHAVLVAALAVPALAVFAPSDAAASVSIAIGFDKLCETSDAVAAITPGEATSNWEDGRIFTYTRVHVDQGIAGEISAGQDTYVRTMGGVVGNIGQMVDGEAVLESGKPSLLFLRRSKTGSFEVAGRGQGQYPIVVDAKTKARSFIRSGSVGMLLPPREKSADQAAHASGIQTQSTAPAGGQSLASTRLAQEALHQRPFEDGAKDIAATWKRVHATPAPAK